MEEEMGTLDLRASPSHSESAGGPGGFPLPQTPSLPAKLPGVCGSLPTLFYIQNIFMQHFQQMRFFASLHK